MSGVFIGCVLAKVSYKFSHDFNSQFICSIIIISIFWKFPVIENDFAMPSLSRFAFTVAYFMAGKTINDNRKPRNAECHISIHNGIMQCHLCRFRVVFVVHEVDDIHSVDVFFGKPLHHFLKILFSLLHS